MKQCQWIEFMHDTPIFNTCKEKGTWKFCGHRQELCYEHLKEFAVNLAKISRGL